MPQNKIVKNTILNSCIVEYELFDGTCIGNDCESIRKYLKYSNNKTDKYLINFGQIQIKLSVFQLVYWFVRAGTCNQSNQIL